MLVQPYIFFDGRCEEALEFYKRAVRAEVIQLLRNKESPDPHPPGMLPPGSENKVMHSTFRIGETTLFGSDGQCQGRPSFEGFSLTLNASNDAEADRMFAALSEGGTVRQPLITTFFSSRFGLVADRFGVPWMVTVAPAKA